MAKKRRRNDAPWAKEVKEVRGAFCRNCGDMQHPQVDHIQERSQMGKSELENGLVLCGPFHGGGSPFPAGCHDAKTRGVLLIEYDWLDEDQIEYLKNNGWVEWDSNGEPTGHGFRAFAPK